MPRRGEYGDTTQRCAYCGKPEVSWFWSINSLFVNRHYCSLECAARDNRSQNLACSLCILPFTALLSVGFVVGIGLHNPIDVSFFMMYGFVLLFQILMAYQVYVGRRP
ncbi:MAG: hypothetical protein ACFFAZ_07560 [Promethearchaeota archaeon]